MSSSKGLLSLWNVPYRRNPYFIGREDILKFLRSAFQVREIVALVQPQSISGLGGIGKTQTAIEYAYRYYHDYQAVFWVRASSLPIFISDFIGIAHLLNLPEKDDQDSYGIIEAVLRWFRINARWLLIIDNVEDLASIAPYIPVAGNGHILLTTRMQSVGKIAQRVEIEKMLPKVGALLLLRRSAILSLEAALDGASENDRMTSLVLSQLMDGLPLAIAQAGAYIKGTSCTLSDYLAQYRVRRSILLEENSYFDKDYSESVATTWSLSFEKAKQANPAAVELLHFCAFLSPDSIPEEIFIDGASEMGDVLHPTANDSLKLESAIREILKFSLIERNADEQTFTMHRLVQSVLKDRMKEDIQLRWAERSTRAVNRAFPEPDFPMWQQCRRCLPHALVCAEHIAEWNLVFPESARLLDRTGYYLRELAQYPEAETLHQQALKVYERVSGLQSSDMATACYNLALLYQAEGKYDEAEELFLQVLTIRKKVLELDHPDLGTTLIGLATLYRTQGKYGKAEIHYQEALTLYERVLGQEHADVATCLNSLAGLYRVQGKYSAADKLYRRALSIREKVLGPEHPDVAASLNGLALNYNNQGQYHNADGLYQQVLAIYEKSVGEYHPHVATCLNNLAINYYFQGEYEAAEASYQRALTIRERFLGSEHPDVAQSLNNLATLYYSQSKYAEAEPLYQRVLEIRKVALGLEHPDTATTFNNLAALYRMQGKYVEAEPLFQQALELREKVLGTEHPDVAASLNNLASFYGRQGEYEKAEPLQVRSLATYKRALGDHHPDVATSTKNLAGLYRGQGKYDEAEVLYLQALAIYKKTLGVRHSDVAYCLRELAELYECQNKLAQAASLYQQSLSIYKETLGFAHPDAIKVLQNYAELLRKMGRKDAAIQLEANIANIS